MKELREWTIGIIMFVVAGIIIAGSIAISLSSNDPCEKIAEDQYQTIQAQKIVMDSLRIEVFKWQVKWQYTLTNKK